MLNEDNNGPEFSRINFYFGTVFIGVNYYFVMYM